MSMGPAADLAMQFRELGEFIDAGRDPHEALRRVAVLARDTVVGCHWVAVTRAGVRPTTLASSDEVAAHIDRIQIGIGDGPCLTAARSNTVVHVPDLAADPRWPAFREAVTAETDLRSLVSFEVDDAPTALNLSSGVVDGFDAEALATAALFATHTQLALLHLNAVNDSSNLRQALTTSRQIGEAVGILMGLCKLTGEQAFDLLRQSSQKLNRKLRDVAADVVDSGTLPG